MRNRFKAAIGTVVALGALLASHPFWGSADSPTVTGGSWSHWFAMMGTTYLVISTMAAGLVHWRRRELTCRRIFGVTLCLFPVLLIIFQSGALQLTPSIDPPEALEFALFMFPATLGFPIGIAIRASKWEVVGVGAFVWIAVWIFLHGFISPAKDPWSLFVLVFVLPYYLFVLMFAVPLFTAGLLVGPHVVENNKMDTKVNSQVTTADE